MYKDIGLSVIIIFQLFPQIKSLINLKNLFIHLLEINGDFLKAWS